MISPLIHAVEAQYSAETFDPNVLIQTEQPISYKCLKCTFNGTLEQAVEHTVTNQFEVKPPKKK